MSISIKKYVDITSGVGGASAVKTRELILRVFTTNALVPAASVLEMTELNDVADKFGTSSDEYKIAAKYFGFVSKLVTKAKKISFARVNTGSQVLPPTVISITNDDLTALKTHTTDTFSFTVNGTPYVTAAVNLGTATSFADVASKLQTAVVAKLVGTTVTYDDVEEVFKMTLPANLVPATIVMGTGALNDALGLDETAEISPGSTAYGSLSSIIEADDISDNYGSFLVLGNGQTLAEIQAIAQWNSAQNVKYQYLVGVTNANYVAWFEALKSFSGCALTLVADTNTEHDEMIPGIILAATDYRLRNAGQNYMFQQLEGFTPKVDSNTLANAIDKTRVNYYGRTKHAGQPIEFYQDGYLCGGITAPTQMNVYANEQWFKDAALVQLMDLLLALPIIPASDEGRSIVLAALTDVINQALFNGTIKAEKDLTTTQKAYIYQITGDPLAWHQVQQIGWWLDATIQQEVGANGATRYKVDYTLLYSKADAVNKITGRDILI